MIEDIDSHLTRQGREQPRANERPPALRRLHDGNQIMPQRVDFRGRAATFNYIFQAMRNATLPMISYAPDPVQEKKAMDGVVLEDEQGIQSGDLAMVDITAHGPSFGETIR